MKKLSSIFVAFAVFCFIVLASCSGSGQKTEEPATQEEVMEAAEDVMETDSAAMDTTAMMEEEAPMEEAQ